MLLAEDLPPHKVMCVRSAVDAAPYLNPVNAAAFRQEFNLPDKSIVVGMVAQPIPYKGHRHLFKAIESLHPNYSNMRMVLFGKGPLQSELEHALSAGGLSDIVRFAGFRTDLPAWLGRLDILAHPADMEGLGVSLLLASAAAVPIVVSRAGDMPEAVMDGETGFLVAPGDVAALTSALRRLLSDAGLRQQMGEAGRTRVLNEFSVDSMVTIC